MNSFTQQNSYSISHLTGTVTAQWLPLWQCSHCSLVPDTVTTEQWLHRTHTSLGIHYHGTYVEICLLGTYWATAQLLHGKTLGAWYTLLLCRNQGGSDTQSCSLPLVPLVGERIVTTTSLSSHSTVTTWGVLLCTSYIRLLTLVIAEYHKTFKYKNIKIHFGKDTSIYIHKMGIKIDHQCWEWDKQVCIASNLVSIKGIHMKQCPFHLPSTSATIFQVLCQSYTV